MPRVIFHVDLDAFYASVEQRENPSLLGVPLIIGADPKSGRGRGVVVACNYEARKLGLRSGQPISIAYRFCPGGVYMRPNLELYGKVSLDVMEHLRKFADKLEQVSIDEAFLDVTQKSKPCGGPIELAKRIKAEIKEKDGLTCSIGIAPNKSAAKIASDYQKPDGLTYIDPEHVKEFLAPLPVSRISGIGKKTEASLNELGIKTIGDLAKYPPKTLYKQFGKIAVWLWAIANGEEQVEVQENYEMKSIGGEHTFDTDTADWAAVDHQLDELVEYVHKRLMEASMEFRTVGLKIRFTGFETYTREKTLKFPTREKQPITATIQELAQEFRTHQKKVRLVGVRLSGLAEKEIKSIVKPTLDSFVAPNS
ncbi:MAG TPA: DNA polymerase IV [Candidatus Dormibacteraeota bacterium]|nr:DNA polymerase IV [Candidatus Dormibacteraeota bacterium]